VVKFKEESKLEKFLAVVHGPILVVGTLLGIIAIGLLYFGFGWLVERCLFGP